jgi:hypothetical protein
MKTNQAQGLRSRHRKFLPLALAVAAAHSTPSIAEMSKREFTYMKFWQGVADIKRCEAVMFADGYNTDRWQKCALGATVDGDLAARSLGQDYEGARYQVELSHLVTGHMISSIPGVSFLREFRPTEFSLDAMCALYGLDCISVRAIIAETAAQLEH